MNKNKNLIKGASKRDGIYPDLERSCRVFFQCVNQQKTREATCPNQLKFNSLSGRCDQPANILAPCGTYTTGSAVSVLSSSKLFYYLYIGLAIKKYLL